MSEINERKPLLKVDSLEQYFKLGKKKTLKAVDDVSFEIYKGEVFSLVGESGCGKTTTGRSIIRLYNINGGSVYFDGKRICAGIRTYKEAIKNAEQKSKAEIKRLIDEAAASGNVEGLKEKIAAVTAEYKKVVEENTAEIKSANYDQKNCNKEFAKFEVAKVKDEYAPKLENAASAVKEAKSAFDAADESSKEEANAKLQEAINAQKVLLKEYKEKVKIASKDRIMNKIQMIFQDPIASLDPRMTVHDIIAEGLYIRGIKDEKYIDEQVYRVLELVGLVPEHATRYPHEFSGGQRQRIGIARAIILNPDLIIADEPVSALDVSIQAQVINLLNDLREKMGLTILFIAHDLSVVKYFSDRIGVMYFGKLVEEASSDELFAHPLHPYTKSLLSAIPLPDPMYEKKRKRIVYNPLAAHDYTKEGPSMREIIPGHKIYCNTEEFERYQKEIKELDNSKK